KKMGRAAHFFSLLATDCSRNRVEFEYPPPTFGGGAIGSQSRTSHGQLPSELRPGGALEVGPPGVRLVPAQSNRISTMPDPLPIARNSKGELRLLPALANRHGLI